ncbi:rhomboid family intramembrane serine protease [Dactylosporangium sp. NPDC050588]|uniref:rhomboid family intramembrane serine protease n=1 Tax=Dactylosporangium sp. NPDC050588 TaxID=3157211 RepID=UPI0033C89E1A
MIHRSWRHTNQPGLVSARYLPGGDLAAELAASVGPAAKARVLLAAVAGLRLAPLYVAAVVGVSLGIDAFAGPQARAGIVAANSTNVANLEQHRLWTLFTSAFVLGGGIEPVQVVALLLLTGAAELVWGRRRLAEVFLLTHVIASCLVYAVLRVGLRHGWLDQEVAWAADVGTSYGAHAVAAALACSLPVRRARRVLVPAVLLLVVLPFADSRTFTSLGHLLSTLIGLLAGWQLRHRPLAGRLRRPGAQRTDRPALYVFGTAQQAQDALVSVLRLREQQLIRLDDAVVAWSDAPGADGGRPYRMHELQTRDLGVLDGALAGAAWGIVLGTLAGWPTAGLAVGAVAAAAVAGVHDAGLSDAVVEQAARGVPAGRAVLVLLTGPADQPRIATVLSRAGGVPRDPAG